MSKIFCISTFKDGQLQNRTGLVKLFRSLKDGKYEISVTKISKRSLNQNAYYWLIMTDYIQPGLYNEGWNTIKSKSDAHSFVADMFLKEKVVNEQTGEIKGRTKSTTELSKEDFNKYLEEIWQWAAEYLSVNIPGPNEQLKVYDNANS